MITVWLRPGRGMLMPVTEREDRAVARAISRAWERFQSEDDRIPDVVLDLTPGRPSACGSVAWADHPVLEVNLQRDGQTLPARDLLAWLLHQAAHGATGAATASEGRYHSVDYRDAAERLGLDVTHRPGGPGFGETALATGTLTRYRAEVDQLRKALADWEPTVTRASQRGPAKFVCSCQPEPRTFRMNAGPAAKGDIMCTICGQPFRATS